MQKERENRVKDKQVEQKAREKFGKNEGREKNGEIKRLNEQITNRFDTKNESVELNNDFFYTAGAARDAHLRQDSEKGHSFDFDVKDGDWLKNSVNPRIERLTNGNFSVKPRTERNTHRLHGHHKDLVNKLVDYQNNPEKIRDATPEQQFNYLNGYLDAKLTVDAKGYSEPTSKMTDNMQRLEVARDILAKHDVDSHIEKPKDGNPSLLIQGFDNHRNLRNNANMENLAKIDKLDNLVENPDRFNKIDSKDFVQARRECGNEFQKLLGDTIPIIRPNTENYELQDPYELGGKIDPDFIVKHPNGRVEGIEAKLNDAQYRNSKDGNYLNHSEIDDLSVYLLEGDKDDIQVNGKDIRFYTKEDLLKELENAREKTDSKEGKETIDKLISDVNNLGEKADKLNSDHKGESSSGQANSGGTDTPASGTTESSEGGGGGGKESKQPDAGAPQDGDQFEKSGSGKKMPRK